MTKKIKSSLFDLLLLIEFSPQFISFSQSPSWPLCFTFFLALATQRPKPIPTAVFYVRICSIFVTQECNILFVRMFILTYVNLL
uniref:Uncharacterized protein n=1 Tax=Helianthus annuus TaxID=4232 RepID=A0A251T0D5_HELAN